MQGLLTGVLVVFWLMGLPGELSAARLKDVVDIEGVRPNQLNGFGLVVGLNGTGDSGNRSVFTTQSLVMMLERMGISTQNSIQQINVKNVAAVMVTGMLAPFARQGGRMDITLSSLGDAKSLEGGTLVMAPLKGADGKVYAVAQGAVSIGGIEVQGGGGAQGGQKNHPTVGRIAGGALVEREIGFELNNESQLQLALKNPDFTTANRVVQAINNLIGEPVAKARDSGTITMQVPAGYKERVVELVARMENIQVEADLPAKIVINERTGTIVMGENVHIATVALSHGNLSVRVQPPGAQAGQPPAAQPLLLAGQPRRLIEMDEGVTLADLINGLNAVGATPKDLIAILQAIKASGALQAEMEIL